MRPPPSPAARIPQKDEGSSFWEHRYWAEASVLVETRSGASTYVDAQPLLGYRRSVEVEASARKHGISDEDMHHAYRQHWRAFETDDPAVTMFIGPARDGAPLEVGIVADEDGASIIHAIQARAKFLKGWFPT